MTGWKAISCPKLDVNPPAVVTAVCADMTSEPSTIIWTGDPWLPAASSWDSKPRGITQAASARPYSISAVTLIQVVYKVGIKGLRVFHGDDQTAAGAAVV